MQHRRAPRSPPFPLGRTGPPHPAGTPPPRSPSPRACTHSSSCSALCSVSGRSGTRLSPQPAARAGGGSKQRDNFVPRSHPPLSPLAVSGALPAEGWKPEKSCQSPGSRCEAAAAIAAAGDAGLRAPGHDSGRRALPAAPRGSGGRRGA